jgi:hypothetical protein
MQRDRLLQNKIHQAFRRSEHQLRKALEARKAEVKVRSVSDFLGHVFISFDYSPRVFIRQCMVNWSWLMENTGGAKVEDGKWIGTDHPSLFK